MFNRANRLRFRRALKRRRKSVEDITVTADDQIERLFFKRLNRLNQVRRFVLTWVLFLLILMGGVVTQNELLANHYLVNQQKIGGSYSEGIVGTLTNANPIYASSSADSALSRLVFSGLFKFDQDSLLIPDIAEKFTVNEKATEFVVTIRKDVYWHDGKPLGIDDIIFTYTLIQNPDAKSPLFTSWQGIKVDKINDYQVRFTLPNSLGSFPYSLTNGIVPKHKLEDIDIAQLRGDAFNTTKPVGTGPFVFSSLEVIGTKIEDRKQSVFLEAHKKYYLGRPKLNIFVLHIFPGIEQLTLALKNGEIDGASGLDEGPAELLDGFNYVEYNVPLNGQTMVFFQLGEGVFNDVKVRRAFIHAANPVEAINVLPYPVIPVTNPLLRTHIGYRGDIQQLPHNIVLAKQLLDEAGWIPDLAMEGVRKKDGDYLAFELTTLDSDEYISVANILKKQWNAIGAAVDVLPKSSDELEQIISPLQHSYQALLYGIAVGNDPDVFVYWHSSQADPRSARLNFSEYKSNTADQALEAGRTRTDPVIRAAKYIPFLEAWRNDAPALGLYQPRYYYIARKNLHGFTAKLLNSATDHYSNVHNWTILTEKQPISL